MSLLVPVTQSFELAPEGAHLARCYRVIDMGTHRNERFQKLDHLAQIGWELPLKQMADGRPFVISKRYAMSIHERSRLRQDLEAWYGKRFDEAKLRASGGFDLVKLLGREALLTITHSEDGQYANVIGLAPLPEGMVCPPAINERQCFLIEQWGDEDAMRVLSPKLKEFIGEAQELNPPTPRTTGRELIREEEEEPF